jgi:hypothetical protein
MAAETKPGAGNDEGPAADETAATNEQGVAPRQPWHAGPDCEWPAIVRRARVVYAKILNQPGYLKRYGPAIVKLQLQAAKEVLALDVQMRKASAGAEDDEAERLRAVRVANRFRRFGGVSDDGSDSDEAEDH